MIPHWTVFCSECDWRIHVRWQWWGVVRFFLHSLVEIGREWWGRL
jgi:hypothetical protein